eukprot:scaffold154536_cov20-Prasinocladus_malaysianus.AAC.1
MRHAEQLWHISDNTSDMLVSLSMRVSVSLVRLGWNWGVQAFAVVGLFLREVKQLRAFALTNAANGGLAQLVLP